MSEKKLGVIFSYLSLIVSSVLSIILTPFMIRTMGDVEYGLYQTVSSFIGILAILDFGSGITTTKYIAQYNLHNDQKGCKNFLAMELVINTIIVVVVSLVGFGFYCSIDGLYSKTFSPSDLSKAKLLAFLYIINVAITIYGNVFHGVLFGFKKYALGNGYQFFKILFRFGLMYILLRCGFGAVAISIADIAANLLFLIGLVLYSTFRLKIIPKLYKWEAKLFSTIFFFSIALFIQAIVAQINNSIDKVLIGSMLGGLEVTIYSIAMSIFLIYGSLSGAIRKVLLPDAVKLVEEHADGTKITDFVINGGRYQFIILSYILCGVILVGKEFIFLWVGENYYIAYYIVIILMVPTLFQLSQNVTETVLDAMGKRFIRSIILMIGAAINVGLTILFIKLWGIIGAPIATAISCILSALIVLNIYHKKVMGLQVLRMFKKIMERTLICAIVALGLSFLVDKYSIQPIYALLIKGTMFTFFYFIFLWLWGFNKNEKAFVASVLNKLFKRRNLNG